MAFSNPLLGDTNADESPGIAKVPVEALLFGCADYAKYIPQTYVPYAGNVAWFVITPTCAVVAGPATSIDEDDVVKITVIGNATLLPLITVRRLSEIRTLGGLSLIGSGVSVDKPAFDKGNEEVCANHTFVLRDFAPGKTVIQVGVHDGTGERVLGSFEFAVSRLYHGMLSIGPVVSRGTTQSFDVVASGNSTVIAPSDRGKTHLRYVVFYTHFAWGSRDLEKPRGGRRLHERLNPSLGLSTQDLAENAYGGVSLDLGALLASTGINLVRERIITPESGLREGDVFVGRAEDIPTSRRWVTKWFGGVTVDLRAMLALISAATSTRK